MQPLALISICSSLVLVRFASTLVIRSRSKLNRCETTSRRWFSLIRIKLLIRISWCSVNARKGAKPVSLRIKSASVNGVMDAQSDTVTSLIKTLQARERQLIREVKELTQLTMIKEPCSQTLREFLY